MPSVRVVFCPGRELESVFIGAGSLALRSRRARAFASQCALVRASQHHLRIDHAVHALSGCLEDNSLVLPRAQVNVMNNIDPEIAQTRPAVLIASVIHLLTCSALHGCSIAKSRSLSQHLAAQAAGPDIGPLLRRTCNELMEAWYQQAVDLSHEQIFDDAGEHAQTAALH